jgi:SecD/SecF fusion protein
MTLSEEQRTERLERWEAEDTQRAKDRPGEFQKLTYAVKRWAEFDRSRVINLGLDLQGGIHTVVSFNWQDLPAERIQQYKDAGLDDAAIQAEVQQVVLQQISRRVNDFEAKEPLIQALGENQIQIQLPGEKDVERAVALIKKTAQLNFHVVAGPDETAPVFAALRAAYPDDFKAFIERPVPGSDGFRVRAENLDRVKDMLQRAQDKGGIIPDTKVVMFSQPPRPWEEQAYSLYLLDKTPLASGEGLSGAGATPDQMNPPFWQIHFQFDGEAATKFGEATQANINRGMAIVLDSMVVSAPVIRDRISTSGQITGKFGGEEARDLSIALNSGSMVVPVKEEFTRKVSSSLGAESIYSGLISSIGAILAVGVFMILYYTSGGFIAVISQALNALFVVALMAYFDMTLTLPGIAGLILTVGMAVDSNVLVFERIREELKLGHSLKSSIENGFARASVTILDANVTTLIAALVLFQFGTGAIQGFAVTLSIGVLTSVFACLVVSRAMFDLALNFKLMNKFPMLQIIPADTKINFMGLKTPAIAISAVIIAVGVVGIGLRGSGNFGVDFTEGTNIVMEVANDGSVSVDAVREALVGAGFENPVVQVSSDDQSIANEFLIRVGETNNDAPADAAAATVAQRMQASLAPLAKDASPENVKVVNEQTVGPAVGAQLRWDALQALIYAHIFIVLYLLFRFEAKFAAGAVVAIVHDVVISLGIYALLGGELSLNVVAAVLTIIGYSLNDTIVIFDRIREDTKLYRGKGLTFGDIINKAVNETLSRTILTSLLTLFVVIVLFLFGGDSINDFALVMIIGLIAGSYSTVFIASPVAYYWQEFVDKRKAKLDAAKGGNGRGGDSRKPNKTPKVRETAAT